MSKHIVLIDMDDVICNLVGPWTAYLNKQFQIDIKFSDLTRWELGEILPVKYPVLTSSDVYAPMNIPGFFRNLPIMPGVEDGLEQMKQLDWRPVIVTSLPVVKHQPGRVIQEKVEWLMEHDRLAHLIHPRDIVITHRKFLVQGDVLIDDGPHNLKEYPGKTIAFDRPWNREIETTGRVYKWSEVINTCSRLFSGE